MNIEVGSEGEVRDPAAAARFEIKFQVRGIGHMGSGYWMYVVDVDEVSPNFSPTIGCNRRYGTACFVTLHQPPRRIAEDTSAGPSVASLALRTTSAVSLRKPVRSPG